MEVVMTVWSHEHTGERGGMMHFPLGHELHKLGYKPSLITLYHLFGCVAVFLCSLKIR